MFKKLLLLGSIAFLCFQFAPLRVSAQNYDPNKIVPATPTASALGAYGNYGVGYYTGTPDIEVPLYDISTTGNKLHIGLQYDASGIKVSQDASWVGLGWSLLAGGVITRTVRGDDDFKGVTGYYYASQLPPAPPLVTPETPAPSDKAAYDEIYFRRLDAEPDIFNYHFAGYSGRFVLGKQVDGSIVYVDQKNDLKIEYTGKWVVTDSHGYKYVFGTGEAAVNYAYHSSTTEVGNTTSLAPFGFDSAEGTSWYLDSIIPPNGDSIQFTYTKGSSLSLIARSESQFDQTDNFTGCPTSNDYAMYYKSYDASRQLNDDVYLKSITYTNGSVEFETSERTDIDYYNVNQRPQKLSGMTVYNKDHQAIRHFSFDYSYFNGPSNTEYARLRLDSVSESSNGIKKAAPYIFSYNGTTLPNKYDKGVDHWGFYNGAANSRLLPMPASFRPTNYLATNDANREPDVSHNYATTGTLTSIKFPTGGHTDFDYELNKYKFIGTESRGAGYAVHANPFDHFDYTTVSFDIKQSDLAPGATSVPATLYYQYGYISDTHLFAGIIVDYGGLNGPNGARFDNSNTFQSDPNGLGGSNTRILSLPVGHYTLNIRYVQGYSVSAILSFTIQVPITEKTGGGIRIARIKTFDNNGTVNIRRFQYLKDDASTGSLIATPVYAYKCPKLTIDGGAICYPSDQYMSRSTGSIYPVGLTSKGTIVGYDMVTELLGENGENGKTEHYFENVPPAEPRYPGVPYAENPLNGSEYKTIFYDAAGNIQKRIENDYSLQETASIKGIKLYTGPPIPISNFGGISALPYNVSSYNNPAYWSVLNYSKVADFYYKTGSVDSVLTSISYTYDNPVHLQVTRQTQLTSDGKILTSLTTYPDDYPAGTAFIDSLRAAHQIALPIERVTYETIGSDIKIIDGSITRFKANGLGLTDTLYRFENVSPLAIASFKFSNTQTGTLPFSSSHTFFAPDQLYKPKVTLGPYDNMGNLLAATPKYGTTTVLIWSYRKQYPVAKISNATYENVIMALGGNNAVENFANSNPDDITLSSFLAPLRTNSLLADALVTTYVYDPAVGVKTVIDINGVPTYYEYDAFQRLQNVKDKDQNIIKNYSYNYALQNPTTITLTTNVNLAGNTYKLVINDIGQTFTFPTAGSVSFSIPPGVYTSVDIIPIQQFSVTHTFKMGLGTRSAITGTAATFNTVNFTKDSADINISIN